MQNIPSVLPVTQPLGWGGLPVSLSHLLFNQPFFFCGCQFPKALISPTLGQLLCCKKPWNHFHFCFSGNFYIALFPSDKQWDLFESPQLISELICKAVINGVTIHWSTVAVLHNTVKLPAATVPAWALVCCCFSPLPFFFPLFCPGLAIMPWDY